MRWLCLLLPIFLVQATLAQGWFSLESWDAAVKPAPGWRKVEEASSSVCSPVPPPRLVSPRDGENLNDNTPELRWENSLPVDNFLLEVDDDLGFASPLIRENLTPSSFETPELSDGLYYWRVKARRVGAESDWSETRAFRVDTIQPAPPAPDQPQDGENFVDNVPTFTWSAPEENSLPLAFEVQVDNDPDFSSIEASSGWVRGQSWRPPPLGQENYYWRVRARDNAGNVGSWSAIRRFQVLDTVPPSPPDPRFPLRDENTNDNRPLFRWGAPPENSLPLKYCVQVSQDRYNVEVSAWVTQENWLCSEELADGLWYWRVCAQDNAGNTGLFSEWTPFTIDTVCPTAPSLLSPENGADIDGTKARFEWTEASDDRTGIEGYLVQFSRDPDFSQTENEFTENSWLCACLPGFGVWYWRVISRDRAGNENLSEARWIHCRTWTELEGWECACSGLGTWIHVDDLRGQLGGERGNWFLVELSSAAVGSRATWVRVVAQSATTRGGVVWLEVERTRGRVPAPVPVPQLLRPENGVHVSKAVLGWDNALPADYFEIQTDLKNPFWRPFRFTYQTWFSAENSIDLTENLPEGGYFWRVRAWRSGACSAWSEAWEFTLDQTVDSPSLQFPENGYNSGVAVVWLGWSEVSDVTPPVEYEVQVSVDPSFPTYISSGWLEYRNWQFSAEGEGVYYWRVRARDAVGNTSQFSEVRCFRVDLTPPPSPSLLHPRAGEWITSHLLTLRWSRVEDPSQPVTYVVLIDNDQSMSSPAYACETRENSISVTIADGTWYWQVVAVDNAGNRSSPAEGYFRVDATAPPIPIQLFPTGAELVTKPDVRFLWTGVWDERGVLYDFVIEGLLSAENLTENSYRLRLMPGSYSWRVRARDTLGNSRGWSSPVGFEVRDISPPVLNVLSPLYRVVDENFLLRVNIREDFGVRSIRVELDNEEQGFVYSGGVLQVRFENLTPGDHIVEVWVRDEGWNENRLSLSFRVRPKVLLEVQAEASYAGDPVTVRLSLRNSTGTPQRSVILVSLGGYTKELSVRLSPYETKTLELQIPTGELKPSSYQLKVMDLSSGCQVRVNVRVRSRLELVPLLVLPVLIGSLIAVGLRLRRKPQVTMTWEWREEEKFPLPLPPIQRETDEFGLRASLLRPESENLTKEWSRLRKRYSGELSPLMQEYARLLREGPPAHRLMERYRKMVRGSD